SADKEQQNANKEKHGSGGKVCGKNEGGYNDYGNEDGQQSLFEIAQNFPVYHEHTGNVNHKSDLGKIGSLETLVDDGDFEPTRSVVLFGTEEKCNEKEPSGQPDCNLCDPRKIAEVYPVNQKKKYSATRENNGVFYQVIRGVSTLVEKRHIG